MARIYVTSDGQPAGWFNPEKAESFDEKCYWNGSNHISSATGSQFHHEKMHLTASGKWVKSWWSDIASCPDRDEIVDELEVAEWFMRQGFQPGEYPDVLNELMDSWEI